MNKPVILMMSVILATVSVACNLSTSTSGASLELTQSRDELIPTATSEPINVVTEEPTLEIITQEPVTNNNSTNVGQVPPTAILPAVTYELIQPASQPSATLCTVIPANNGTLVNVRRGADLGYDVILQLKTWAVVQYKVNGWYAIDIDEPHNGFVSSTVTTLQGDCSFLNPTPLPMPLASECYLDIPLMVGDEVPYFDEPQYWGNQKLGDMATFQLLIRGEKAGWYEVINYQNVRGWVPANMGQMTGNCNNIPSIAYDTPICIIVSIYEGDAYYTPFTGEDRFGAIPAGEGLGIIARTVSDWYGFEPGIPQAPNEGLDRLRWVYPNNNGVFQPVGDCDLIPVVYDAAQN